MYQPRPCWLLFPYLKGAWYWKTSCLFWSSNMNHWIWVFFEMKWNYFSTEYDCKIKCYVGLNPKVVKTQTYWLKWRRKIWIIMGKTGSKNGDQKISWKYLTKEAGGGGKRGPVAMGTVAETHQWSGWNQTVCIFLMKKKSEIHSLPLL